MICCPFKLIYIFTNPTAAHILKLFDPVDFFLRDAIRIMDETGTVGQGDHLAAQHRDLLGRMGCNIT